MTNTDADGAARGYLLAIEDYPLGDVQAAVRLLITGQFAEHDGRYPPTPPQLGRACRHVLNRRVEAEDRDRRLHPHLPPPDVVKTAESRARVAGMVAQLVGKMAETARTEDAAAAKRRAEQQRRTDERFKPEMDPEAVKRRLHLDYTVGDAAGDAGSE